MRKKIKISDKKIKEGGDTFTIKGKKGQEVAVAIPNKKDAQIFNDLLEKYGVDFETLPF